MSLPFLSFKTQAWCLTGISLRSISIRVASILILSLLAACSSTRDASVPHELKSKKDGESLVSEKELFDKGNRLYDNKLYSVAKESFLAFKEQFPLSPLAETAEKKAADCEFETENYKEAALAYDDFSKNRPASLSASYVLFRAGRSYQLSYGGEGRDPQPLETARQRYHQLFERFPDAPEAKAAQPFFRDTLQQLAAQEFLVAHFYEKKGSVAAAATRRAKGQELQDQFENELLKSLAEDQVGQRTAPASPASGAAEALPAPADTPQPDSEMDRQALPAEDLKTPAAASKPVSIEATPSGEPVASDVSVAVPTVNDSALSVPFQIPADGQTSDGSVSGGSLLEPSPGHLEESALASDVSQTYRLECKKNLPVRIVITLTKELSDEELQRLPSELHPQNKLVVLPLAVLTGGATLSCFGDHDLELGNKELKLLTEERWAVFTLAAPYRIILTALPQTRN